MTEQQVLRILQKVYRQQNLLDSIKGELEHFLETVGHQSSNSQNVRRKRKRYLRHLIQNRNQTCASDPPLPDASRQNDHTQKRRLYPHSSLQKRRSTVHSDRPVLEKSEMGRYYPKSQLLKNKNFCFS